jgi:hypothetical protein
MKTLTANKREEEKTKEREFLKTKTVGWIEGAALDPIL